MAKVSKRLRFEILRRDQFKCRYCGTVAAERELRVDHVIPEALGGPSDWSGSVDAFIRAGLDDKDLAEAVDIAMGKKHIKTESLFKYFCGICWRVLEERRETAATLVHLIDTDEEGS